MSILSMKKTFLLAIVANPSMNVMVNATGTGHHLPNIPTLPDVWWLSPQAFGTALMHGFINEEYDLDFHKLGVNGNPDEWLADNYAHKVGEWISNNEVFLLLQQSGDWKCSFTEPSLSEGGILSTPTTFAIARVKPSQEFMSLQTVTCGEQTFRTGTKFWYKGAPAKIEKYISRPAPFNNWTPAGFFVEKTDGESVNLVNDHATVRLRRSVKNWNGLFQCVDKNEVLGYAAILDLESQTTWGGYSKSRISCQVICKGGREFYTFCPPGTSFNRLF